MCDKHHFVFEFDKAYNHQLIEKFEASPEHPLTPDVAQPLKGVYALYHRGQRLLKNLPPERFPLSWRPPRALGQGARAAGNRATR
jgi:hypothetical protein